MISCRFCNTELTHIFCDLGYQPPSNSFLTKKQLNEPETHYPLKVYVCDKCWLVQIPETKKATDIFKDDYPYFSSQSPANVSHAKEYVDMMCERFKYGENSRILEIGSNDGYMLQWFKARGCSVLGIDPAIEPSQVANSRGIRTYPTFFSTNIQWSGNSIEKLEYASYNFYKPKAEFDLICSINTIAHQPDINDFVKGLKIALKPNGITTHEFPYLMKLVDRLQFDTIYHEHYNYYSLSSISTIFKKYGLEIFDVEELPEHGGSLRIYAQHQGGLHETTSRFLNMLLDEYETGIDTLEYYQDFQDNIKLLCYEFLDFYNEHKKIDNLIIPYGAAAKCNTFFSFCNIKSNVIPFIIDRSPHKIGKYLPGSHIPVVDESILKELQPAYVLITAWNLKEEIIEQLSYIRDWGGRFVVAIPRLEVI